MLFAFFVLNVFTIACAAPFDNGPRNVITVPPNCPDGQEWINGVCRDIWRAAVPPAPERKVSDVSPANVITVPPNCPPGQEYINGQCRDIWRRSDLALLLNQKIENLWNEYVRKIQQERIEVVENSDVAINNSPRHIINVPNQCPIGFKADALGICRPIF